LDKIPSRVREIWIARDKRSERAGRLVRLCKERDVSVRFRSSAEIKRLFPDISHQGYIALVDSFRYRELDEIAQAGIQEGNALIIALDHITDEGNLASIIRTAAFFGAQGLVIPKDRSAGVSPRVAKRSAGASVWLPIARVVNLGRALDILDKRDFWIVGTGGESPETIHGFDWRRNLVLVLGNEEKGLTKGIRKRCHKVLSIPGRGGLDSLNVGVAAGVVLSEIARQRKPA